MAGLSIDILNDGVIVAEYYSTIAKTFYTSAQECFTNYMIERFGDNNGMLKV